MKRIILFLLFMFFIPGCTGPNTLIHLTGTFRTTTPEIQKKEFQAIKALCRQEKLGYKNITIESHQETEFTNQAAMILDQEKGAIIFPDPLLNLSENELAARYPDKLFISLKAQPSPPLPNILTIDLSAREAFYRAGEVCGYLLKDPPPFLEEIKAPGEKPKIGILAHEISRYSIEENNSFIQGVQAVFPGEDVVITRNILNIMNKKEISDKAGELHRQGCVIFLLRLFSSDILALETLKKTGGAAIVEEWDFPGTFLDKTILLSINLPPRAVIESALKTGYLITNTGARWQKEKTGATYAIAWGEALPEDEAIRQLLSAPGKPHP